MSGICAFLPPLPPLPPSLPSSLPTCSAAQACISSDTAEAGPAWLSSSWTILLLVRVCVLFGECGGRQRGLLVFEFRLLLEGREGGRQAGMHRRRHHQKQAAKSPHLILLNHHTRIHRLSICYMHTLPYPMPCSASPTSFERGVRTAARTPCALSLFPPAQASLAHIATHHATH